MFFDAKALARTIFVQMRLTGLTLASSGSAPSEDRGTCDQCPPSHYSVSGLDGCFECTGELLLLIDNDCVSRQLTRHLEDVYAPFPTHNVISMHVDTTVLLQTLGQIIYILQQISTISTIIDTNSSEVYLFARGQMLNRRCPPVMFVGLSSLTSLVYHRCFCHKPQVLEF